SQPRVMAVMLEQLQVHEGQRVLEIGTGTGYNAALLADLVGETGQVTTVDIDNDLVEQARRHLAAAHVTGVNVVCADGAGGWSAGAPYDRIMLTVGAWDVAPAWVNQLTTDGRLVLPLSLRGVQRCVAFQRTGEYLTSVSVAPCGFMPLRGQMTSPQSIIPLGDQPGLFLQWEDQRTLDTAALSTALCAPAELLATGIRVSASEVFDGLALWLALHQPDLGQLSAMGAAAQRGLVPPLLSFPSNLGTGVLPGRTGPGGVGPPGSTRRRPRLVNHLRTGRAGLRHRRRSSGTSTTGRGAEVAHQRPPGHRWTAHPRLPPRPPHRRPVRSRHRQALLPIGPGLACAAPRPLDMIRAIVVLGCPRRILPLASCHSLGLRALWRTCSRPSRRW
ncbi:MAG TPA: methyltransferase domain-containing protein, partial [Pseudonocardiaceae bacterium]|nr:methyltransferase domain-containing protein [Pseudonocardiaceae bacterium]